MTHSAFQPIFGLTKREYFAAAAPHEIPHWFYPDFPERPDLPDWIEIPQEDADLREEARLLVQEGIGEPRTPEGKKWWDNYRQIKSVREVWETRRQAQRAAEWPWYWADLVLGEHP